MNYLNELNEIQRKAVEQTDGAVMIIAGAGSGKTRVLTYRIAHLINKGVDSFNILALTFTNKAAKEMKERIFHIVGGEAKNIWMGTFHSVFAKILRVEAEKLGYPNNFTIYDTDDSKALIKSIVGEMGLDEKIYKPGLVLGRISNAKNNLISARQYNESPDALAEDRMAGKPKMGEIYLVYEQRCYKASAMDFDDLLFKTNVLLRKYPDTLYKYQQKFRYIMVDEYQDTNFSQYLIVKKLAAMYQNICVVGDDAQSIYAFRGANIQNILNFEKDYPELKVFKLEQNYRSTKMIVEAANSVIKNNKDQLPKIVWTDNQSGEKIKIIHAETDNEEAQLIAGKIFELRMNSQISHQDMAILYRTNAQSRALEEQLRRKNIPYRIYGGLSFYKRKEIKDILAYFRLTINHSDEEALKRVINYPARGIGKTSLEKMTVAAGELNQPLWKVMEELPYNNALEGAVARKVLDFITMIKSFAQGMKTQSAYDIATHIARSSGLLAELNIDKTPEGISRQENVMELLNAVQEYVDGEDVTEDGEIKEKNLATFIQDVALLTDADDDDDNPNKVSLMTIHAAKGLEFKAVFIAGMEENLFPSQLSLNSREELEEERRLFYVALTRAEDHLFISYANHRYRWGTITSSESSRFIDEIDSRLVEFPTSNNSSSHQSGFFSFDDDRTSFSNVKKSPTQTIERKTIPPKRNLVSVSDAQKKSQTNNPDFQESDPALLQSGMEVEHQRFGVGKILNIEGKPGEQKATIFFQDTGQKQLLLKFAKLRII
jgi:DNA helicase-2/ATP-dependent DNA helicase PcrA